MRKLRNEDILMWKPQFTFIHVDCRTHFFAALQRDSVTQAKGGFFTRISCVLKKFPHFDERESGKIFSLSREHKNVVMALANVTGRSWMGKNAENCLI